MSENTRDYLPDYRYTRYMNASKGSQKRVANHPQEGNSFTISDECNPRFLFSLTNTELLVKIVAGTVNAKELAEAELSNRGLDDQGNWKGFRN